MVSAFIGRLNNHAIDNVDVKVHPSDFRFESNYESVTYLHTNMIKWIFDDEMDHLLEFFHSEHEDDILDVDLQMIQDWLLIDYSSKFYTVSTVFFHNNGEANVAVTNFMSNFLCLSQLIPLWNWQIETRDMPKELGLSYVIFITVQLYIQLDQFIIVQVNL